MGHRNSIINDTFLVCNEIRVVVDLKCRQGQMNFVWATAPDAVNMGIYYEAHNNTIIVVICKKFVKGSERTIGEAPDFIQ